MAVQIAVVSGMALLITVGVYALVAAIVKLDDAGLYLVKVSAVDIRGRVCHRVGRGLLTLAPMLMKTLSIVGTAAMFMVGGGILMHGLPGAHDLTHYLAEAVHGFPLAGAAAFALMPTIVNAMVGILAGGLLVFLVSLAQGILLRLKAAR